MALRRTDDGVIYMRTADGWNKTDDLETAKENVVIMRAITQETPCAFLVEPHTSYISKEVLQHYNEANIDTVATAMITNSFASKVVGNLYLKIMSMVPGSQQAKDYPIKLFSNEEEALAWLRAHINAAKKR
jgi:hypothetical protein